MLDLEACVKAMQAYHCQLGIHMNAAELKGERGNLGMRKTVAKLTKSLALKPESTTVKRGFWQRLFRKTQGPLEEAQDHDVSDSQD